MKRSGAEVAQKKAILRAQPNNFRMFCQFPDLPPVRFGLGQAERIRTGFTCCFVSECELQLAGDRKSHYSGQAVSICARSLSFFKLVLIGGGVGFGVSFSMCFSVSYYHGARPTTGCHRDEKPPSCHYCFCSDSVGAGGLKVENNL